MKDLRSATSSLSSSLLTLLVCLGGAFVACGQAPVTVFDSFGPGNAVGTFAWGVNGASVSSGYRGQAEWFVPNVSGYLSSITLQTYHYGGSGFSDFFVAEDSGSSTPGTILESFPGTLNAANGLLTLHSSGTPLLQAGVRYWLCDEPTDSTSQNGWLASQNYSPGFAFERSQWSWEYSGPTSVQSGAFRVQVTPVPEPSALALSSLAALSWLSVRVRSRLQRPSR